MSITENYLAFIIQYLVQSSLYVQTFIRVYVFVHIEQRSHRAACLHFNLWACWKLWIIIQTCIYFFTKCLTCRNYEWL